MRVKIHQHTSKHECETCGCTWNSIYTVRGALGQYEHGDEAYCYGTEDGDITFVVNYLMEELKRRGFVIDIPSTEELDNLKVDWKAYHDGIDSEIYDWYENVPDDVKAHNLLNDKIEEFYSTGWKKVLNSCGYELRFKYTEDEDEYYSDDY